MRVPVRRCSVALILAKHGAHSAADCLHSKKPLCFISVRGGLCKSHSISKGILRFLGAFFMVFTAADCLVCSGALCFIDVRGGLSAAGHTPYAIGDVA